MSEIPVGEAPAEAPEVDDAQAEVVTAVEALDAADLPEKPADAAEQLVQAVLLLPAGTVVDAAIEAEMVRLGAAAAIVAGPSGQSPQHDAAAAAGLDSSTPIVWVEQVLYDTSATVAPSVDAGVAAPTALDKVAWTPLGTKKILEPLAHDPAAQIRVSLLLDGDAEVQLLEDGLPIALEPANLAAPAAIVETTTVKGLTAGSHAYQLQAIGSGTVEAVTLAVVTIDLVPRAAEAISEV